MFRPLVSTLALPAVAQLLSSISVSTDDIITYALIPFSQVSGICLSNEHMDSKDLHQLWKVHRSLPFSRNLDPASCIPETLDPLR